MLVIFTVTSDTMREKKRLSHSLIADSEVLIKGIVSFSIPVHEIYLHQVLSLKSKDIDNVNYYLPRTGQ